MFIPLDQAPQRALRPDSSAISASDWAVLADFWFPVAFVRELGDEPFKARLLDVDLVLFRGAEGEIAVLRDVCPHRLVRLSAGRVENGRIVCPFHGLRFDATGACRQVPVLGGGDVRLPPSYRVQGFPVQIKYGLVWTCLGDATRHALPVFPAVDAVPPERVGQMVPALWPMSAARQIENFFDLAHLPYVHANTLGGDPLGVITPGRIEQREDGVTLHARYLETRTAAHPVPCRYTYRVVMPFNIEFQVEAEDDPQHTMLSCDIASPVSAHETRVFQLLVDAQEGGPLAGLADALTVVNGEDMAIFRELTVPDLPLDQRHEIHLPVDNISNAYRARLRDLGLGQRSPA